MECVRKLKLSYPELENMFLNATFDDLPYKISRENLLSDLEDGYYNLINVLETKQINNAAGTDYSVYM